MQDLITSILTDASTRDSDAIESILIQQSVSTPWIS